MGWLFPRTYLRWTEPAPLRQAREALEDDRISGLFRLKVVLVFAGLGLLNWAVAWLDPKKHPIAWPYALLGALGFGLFGGYVIPWLALWEHRWSSSYIWVREDGINWVVGRVRRFWKYGDVPSCRIVSTGPGSEATSILELRGPAGESLILGIAPSVPLDELGRVLAEHGVQVELVTVPDPTPPSDT